MAIDPQLLKCDKHEIFCCLLNNMLIKFTSNYKITGTRFSPNRDENLEKLKNLLIALDIFTLLSNYSDEKLDFS